MCSLRGIGWVVVGLSLVGLSPAMAEKGRVYEEGHRTRISVTIGDRTPITGSVVETSRPINQLRDNPDAPESFTFEELGLSESDSTYGLSFERQWKWITLFIDGTWMQTEATGVAPRDLFIGVKDVRFDGQSFEYQQVSAGETYTGDLDLLAVNVRGAFTPVTVGAGGPTEFVPWVHLGLFTLAGQFDIDAGPALGTVLYENPERTYVQGGRSEGDAAAFAPEIGLGGELEFRTGERARLSFIGNYSVFEFKGSTGDLGVPARREKDVDASYSAIDFKAFYEFPMSNGTNFVIGAAFRQVEVDAMSSATDKNVEDVLELREKFDKRINLEIETLVVNFGIRW